jgi:hypothetical protein
MKVLFLDSWTKAIRMFHPIRAYLEPRGIDSLLVHYGSWDAEPGRPAEEVIDGLRCRDISYYRTRLLYRVLQRERPDCIVSLTTNNLIDRAKILAARALGIPSVFLMHGVFATTPAAIRSQVGVVRSALRRKRFSKIPKHLGYILPNYLLAGMAEKPSYLFTREPYRVIFNTFRFPEKWKMYPAPSQELQCDRCLAWGHAYKEFLVEAYGYGRDAIRVVGHPPLDKACRLLRNPPREEEVRQFQQAQGIPSSRPIVLYVEGAFVYSGYEGWTRQSWLEHLLEMAELCACAGRHLVVKLHPSTEGLSELQARLGPGATVLQDADAEMLLWMAESVIGHSSTLLNSAIVLDRPVLIPRWGISRVIPAYFDGVAPVLTCETPDALAEAVRRPKHCRDNLRADRGQYLRDYLEPLDGNSQQRIGEAIAQAASRLPEYPIRRATSS